MRGKDLFFAEKSSSAIFFLFILLIFAARVNQLNNDLNTHSSNNLVAEYLKQTTRFVRARTRKREREKRN